MVGEYEVVTLCGSTKFKDEFLEVQKRLTLSKHIVISVGLFGHSGDDEAWAEGTKEMLYDMHKRKIDMADSIFVIDVNGYIGESTKKEIEYAKSKGKYIYFYSTPEVYFDNVGGFHDSSTGHNPNGLYCGDCIRSSCEGCERANLTK
jgi:hypothetical protein